MAVRWAVASGNFSSTSTWNDGAILGIPTGSDDVFTNGFTVNMDVSTVVTSLNNIFSLSAVATPQMTSNSTPSPYAASATNEVGGAAWLAFNRVISDFWGTSSAASGVATLTFDFSAADARIIKAYSIYGTSDGNRNPRVWTFDGSNDGSTWTTLDSVTLGTGIGSNAVYNSSILSNTTAYRYYRLNITATNSMVWVQLAELALWEASKIAISAGGSFNFNSGSISGSVTSATPLSAGATNLITVTATTGSVSLSLGGAVTPRASNGDVLILHSGNCNFNITGSNFNGLGGSTVASTTKCISKTSSGTITIIGNLNGGTQQNGGIASNEAFTSNNGNTIVIGNVIGGSNASGGGNRGISQTAGILTITGNITGGQIRSDIQGVLFSGTSMRVNGNVIGGTTSVAIDSTAPIFIVGDVSGSAAAGISTTAPVIVSGSVVAQGAAAAISSTSAIFINVSGSVIASATANGISSTNASAVVNLAGNIVNVNGKQAIYCQNLFLDNTATTQARFFTFGGSDRTLYSSDTFPNLPSASNVRFGTTYGPGAHSEFGS